MKGIQKVRIFNKKIKYDFELSRNITVIRGDSGTGKTSLYDMIAEYTRLGRESGVNIECKKNCVALTDTNWESQLKGFKNSIVFIDEGFKEINSPKFAKLIKNSDNYYVIFNRENLYELPYSVEEIYQIKTSGKLHTLKKMYAHNKNITKDKIYKYSKSRLGKYYKTKVNEEKVLSQIMQIK